MNTLSNNRCSGAQNNQLLHESRLNSSRTLIHEDGFSFQLHSTKREKQYKRLKTHLAKYVVFLKKCVFLFFTKFKVMENLRE
jgi:hypothetical protein